MKTLHIGRGLELPLETAVVQRYGFIGTVGSGKSSTAQVLAEEFLDHGVQVVTIDPTGTWWGLRAKREDASEPSGLPISVIGGKNGDLPIDLERGAEYARWVVEKLPSVIFDLKGARPGKREQFVTAFMRELYRLKGEAKERTPLHVFLEEAQRWAAQQPSGREEKEISYLMREIAEMIRNDGVGLSYITQAPQAVDKRQLNLTECLFIHQVNGKHERSAVKDWAVDKGEDLGDVDLVSLEIGQAIIWSPRWLKLREKVTIRLKRTFYAGSTLKFGEKVANVAPPLPEAALADLRAALAEASKTAEANDPKALQREVVRLRAELAKKSPAAAAPAPVEIIREKVVFKEEHIRRIEKAADLVDRVSKEAATSAAELQAAIPQALELARDLRQLLAPAAPLKLEPLNPAKLGLPMSSHEEIAKRGVAPYAKDPFYKLVTKGAPALATNGFAIRGKMKDMLAALKTWHPKRMPARRLALFVGMSVSSGTWSDYMSGLRSQELIDDSSGEIALGDNGLAVTKGIPSAPPTTDQLVQRWLPKLRGKSKGMLVELVTAGDAGLSADDLAEKLVMSAGSGTWSDYLSLLNAAGLLRKESGRLYASEMLLYPEAG